VERFDKVLRGTRFLAPAQAGFRKGHQTEEHIFLLRRVVEDCAALYGTATETGQACAAILLDIQKARGTGSLPGEPNKTSS
ncbi:unnamed protein product, partial [Amoebophrya sp. A120]